MPTAIRIVDASKSFNRSARALNAVGATIMHGECLALVGASGSGKSTLLRSMCGLKRLNFAHSRIETFGIQYVAHAEELEEHGYRLKEVNRPLQDNFAA